MCGVGELVRGRPYGVLGCEEARELAVVDLDTELCEQCPHFGWILDLLDHARCEETCEVGIAESVGDARARLPADCGETGGMPGLEHAVRGRPAHERVAPVEQNRIDHRPLT